MIIKVDTLREILLDLYHGLITVQIAESQIRGLTCFGADCIHDFSLKINTSAIEYRVCKKCNYAEEVDFDYGPLRK